MAQSKYKDKQIKARLNPSIRLKDLNKQSLFRSIQEIEEYDKIHYRRTCGPYQQPRQKKKTKERSKEHCFEMFGSSSDESIDYHELQSYKPGSLGLIRIREKKERFPRPPSVKKASSKDRNFDRISAFILSELRLVNKFEKKGENDLVKIKPVIRDNRKYYVP